MRRTSTSLTRPSTADGGRGAEESIKHRGEGICPLPYVFAPCECSGFRRFSKSTLFCISTLTPVRGATEPQLQEPVPVHISIHAPTAKGATLWRGHRRGTGEVIRHGLVLPTVFALLPMGVIRHAHPLTRKYVYIIQYLMNIAKLIAYFNHICHAPRFLFAPAVV